MNDEILYCIDLNEVPGKPQCCNSCHDDEEAGYDGLLEIYDGDHLTHRVCCAMHTWLQKQAATQQKKAQR